MRTRFTAVAQWLVAALLIAAAWWFSQHTPSMWMISAPVAERAELEERIEGRNIAVTISGLRGASQLHATLPETSDSGPAESEGADAHLIPGGPWLLVDVEAALTETEPGALVFAELVLGDTRYRASERVDSLFEQPLQIAAPVSGTLAFELPAQAAEMGPAELQLGLNLYAGMDSLITLEVHPEDIDHNETAELLPSQWTDPVGTDNTVEADSVNEPGTENDPSPNTDQEAP